MHTPLIGQIARRRGRSAQPRVQRLLLLLLLLLGCVSERASVPNRLVFLTLFIQNGVTCPRAFVICRDGQRSPPLQGRQGGDIVLLKKKKELFFFFFIFLYYFCKKIKIAAGRMRAWLKRKLQARAGRREGYVIDEVIRGYVCARENSFDKCCTAPGIIINLDFQKRKFTRLPTGALIYKCQPVSRDCIFNTRQK